MNLFSISPSLFRSRSVSVDSIAQRMPVVRTETLESESLETTCIDAELPVDLALAELSQATEHTEKPSFRCELEIFASTFITIFLAELGDKTQLTTLLMSAESQSPWLVFAGAGTALVCTSLLGILLGRWLATKVSPKTLELSAGLILLFIATMLFWDILHA